MGLKEYLGNLEGLAVFCFVMALLSWMLPIGMTIIWLLLGLLYQLGRAEGLKSSVKGLLFKKKEAPFVAPAPVAA